MVELTILGNYGPYATAQGACSGYIINTDGFQIMLDCGHGVFSKLQKYADYTTLGISTPSCSAIASAMIW